MLRYVWSNIITEQSFKISKGQSEAVNPRMTGNAIFKKTNTVGHNTTHKAKE
jgi:hypothetical protein